MSLLDTVKQAGIVGAGGAGFPTHVKLNAKAEWFIVNAAECEPLIETDKFLCRTQAPKIIAAAQAVAAHLGAAHTVIALKEKYLPEIAALEEAIAAAGAKIEICRMGVFYPAGDEQTMVQYVTGRSVPERGLPLDVGAVVDNVGTLVNLYDAMTDGRRSLTNTFRWSARWKSRSCCMCRSARRWRRASGRRSRKSRITSSSRAGR